MKHILVLDFFKSDEIEKKIVTVHLQASNYPTAKTPPKEDKSLRSGIIIEPLQITQQITNVVILYLLK